jgi:hypothetical protein
MPVVFIQIHSVFAAYRSRDDPSSLAFVFAAYAALLLLLFERAPRADKGRVKAEVWALTTLLTVMFTSRVAPLMPPPVGVTVWAVAAATASSGFWAFFLAH